MEKWGKFALSVISAACIQNSIGAELQVLEPLKTETVKSRVPERGRWHWNQAQASISPTGDIQWKPHAFTFEKGDSLRYIDFAAGNDTNSGTTKAAAWKHHPWDPQATGKSRQTRGIFTYIFKRGVTYHGTLFCADSGTADNPVRLTSDPSWGAGEAVICGSERVTGWKKGAPRAGIPDSNRVWYADINFMPRNLWEQRASKVERIVLARTPNWKVSNFQDVMSEWWQWSQPEWWTDKNVVKTATGSAWLGIDTIHLNRSADYYTGAIVRTEYGIVMGTPFPTLVEGYDSTRHGIIFQGIWLGASEKIIARNRYYLEDKPQYLDTTGEFWFERNQAENGGRLYLRLAAGRDPNIANIEAGKQISIIEALGMNHVKISGLSFRFTNTHWDLQMAGWGHRDVANACIRILGPANDVSITNCKFEHAAKAVRIHGNDSGLVDGITIADNDIRFIDHGAIQVGGTRNFGQVKILRNNLFTIGMRPFRQDHGHALNVEFPERMEIAGNVLDRCFGAGIFVFGGKGSGDGSRERPFIRNLIYNNKVTHALLAANDWGAIETWQSGPYYVYNNVSGDPCGYWNWMYSPEKEHSGRLGMAYYLDGCYKAYHFNNIAWGVNNDPKSPLENHAAFYEATPTIENTYVNNTIYKFALGSNWSPAGGRHFFLGNLWIDLSSLVFQHGQLKEDKGQKAPAEYPHALTAYGNNVFFKPGKRIAVFEADGKPYEDLASFNVALSSHKQMCDSAGRMAVFSPVRNAAGHDFRPATGSAAVDYGVKAFVPWSLSRTVGEWNFRRNNADPTMIVDNHWYMTRYYVHREGYHTIPVNSLKAVNVQGTDYVTGSLEDWCAGALQFNGKDKYAILSNADMTRPYKYQERGKSVSILGKDLATPDVNRTGMLIETYFRTEPGHAGSVLVSKLAGSGYQLSINKAGSVTFTVRSGKNAVEIASGALVNDGGWHHVIAELDRRSKTLTICTDGNLSATRPSSLADTASLSNAGNLYVGRGNEGHYFNGTVDFLRITRGTLADSRTTIEELYDWEFDGPFLKDFTGHQITGKRRDAGALEYVKSK